MILQDHPFTPMERDARYCGYMGPARVLKSQHGAWSMRTECGYPPQTHPAPAEEER